MKILPAAVALLVFAICCPAQSTNPSPASATDAVAERVAEVKDLLREVGPGVFHLGGIEIRAASREVRLPCRVLHQELPIEYMLVHETGKDHETVLITSIRPIDLHVALLLANYTPGSAGLFAKLPPGEPKPFEERQPATPGGHLAKLTLEWLNEKGEPQTAPISAWYQNSDTRKPPPDAEHWVFHGSRITEQGYMAEVEGSIAAVYADPNALFIAPTAGNHRDDLWISLPAAVPAGETPVTLVITPVGGKNPVEK
jgi:hypothetical protein